MEFAATPSIAPVAIALVDASHSVKDSFFGSASIFTKFCDILKSLPHQHFYLQFWSSPGALGSPLGTLKFPFQVERSQLSQPFAVCLTKEFLSTFPHLGFVGIDDWLEAGHHTVYLLTDGAMSNPSSPDLKNAVSHLMTSFPDVQLHLITVEARDVALQTLEDTQGLVGGDVYHILVRNHMTHLLSGFVSYTRNYPSGYKHLSRVRAPPGYLSFRDRLFREVDMPKFFAEVQRLVSELDPQDEEKLLQLLQDLVTPVARAQRDKPAGMVQAMTNNFASLFAGTCINPQVAVFLLSSGCTSDNAGQVQVLADFRRQLRDVFKSAQNMLCAGVSNAIGLSQSGNRWMSLPMACRAANPGEPEQVIVVGPAHHLDKDVALQGSTFRQGTAQLGNTLIGALPMITGELPAESDSVVTGGLTEQCTRQWVRALAARTYGVNATSDIVVYLIMALNAQVSASAHVDDAVKKAWANLAKIMLRKKRVNSTDTEWDRLERGEFPLPNNGQRESLETDLFAVLKLVGGREAVHAPRECPTQSVGPVPCREQCPTGKIGIRWPDIWRALCVPLGLKSQLRHCVHEVFDNFAEQIVWPDLGFHSLPMEDLEYKCGITMESTAQTGGFKLLEHTSRTGYQCSPRLVFSEEGMRALLADSAPRVCPICYAAIDHGSFVAVGPATSSCLGGSSASFGMRLPTFTSNPLLERAAPAPTTPAASQPAKPVANPKPKVVVAAKCTDATKGIIFLKGTRGCGKTTFAEKVKGALISAAPHGLEISVCVIDGDLPEAKIKALDAVRAGVNYIIIDACFFKTLSSFGIDVGNVPCCTVAVNYDKQSEDLAGLLAWSWRNVARSGGDWADFDHKARVAYGKARVRKALGAVRREGDAVRANAYAEKIDAISAQQLACVLTRFKVAA